MNTLTNEQLISIRDNAITMRKEDMVGIINRLLAAEAQLAELASELEKQKAITRRVSEESNRLFDEKKALTGQLAELQGQEPYAYAYQYAGCETCEGFQDWRSELSKERPPEWMLEDGKVTDLIELFARAVPPAASHPVPDDSDKFDTAKLINKFYERYPLNTGFVE